MLTKDVIKLQEKILKWLCKGKDTKQRYFYELDGKDILISDSYVISRIDLTEWFIDIRDMQTAKNTHGNRQLGRRQQVMY